MSRRIKRAIISVTDKDNLVDFARALEEREIEIIASGGTAARLKEAGVEVIPVSEVTGFPEIMNGRVKTLHPLVHGGILADRDNQDHLREARENNIDFIDLIVVNLYRFRESAAKPELSERDVVESIDIGGPTLIRSSAKNYHSVAVVVDPNDYDSIISEIDRQDGSVGEEMRRELAARAFRHTASYESAIASYFNRLTEQEDEPPQYVNTAYRRIRTLRYGENPHLKGALYRNEDVRDGFGDFRQLQGKKLSFNNIRDMYAAFMLTCDLGGNSCAIIKHTNPCGAAVCETTAESFRRARETDPVSAFGSVVSVNGSVDAELAELSGKGFLEVIIARRFEQEALKILKKKKRLRLITLPEEVWEADHSGWSFAEAGDLVLCQQKDTGFPELDSWKVVTSRKPVPEEEKSLRLAWKLVKHIKSNAIVISDSEGTVGVGAGQMSRVESCWIAVEKARKENMKIEGASAASDAFFPFPDGVETLVEAGVKSIIQPGGSIRDEQVIEAAEKLGITMILTGRRHFRH